MITRAAIDSGAEAVADLGTRARWGNKHYEVTSSVNMRHICNYITLIMPLDVDDHKNCSMDVCAQVADGLGIASA